MKKSKFIATIMALSTIFTMSLSSFTGVVNATDTNNYDMMLISENPMTERAEAPQSISVLLNGDAIDFTDDAGNVVEPQIINSRTMVPMRKIFEVLGAEINWNGETGTVTATSEERVLTLQIGNEVAKILEAEEERNITLDAAPTIVDGRTLVPVRFIAESLDLKVGWDASSRTVVIINPTFILEKIKTEAPTFYEYLESNMKKDIKSFDATVSMNGTLKYTDSSDKSNNTNLKMTLKGTEKMSENKNMALDFTLKTTGKGSLYEEVKENDFDNITLNILLDYLNKKEYIKSSLLESEIGKKWARIDLGLDNEELEKLTESAEKANTLEEVIDLALDNIELTPTTYYEIEEMLDIICPFVSDKFFSVSGRNAKTYTYELSLSNAIELLNLGLDEDSLDKIKRNYDLKISIELKEDEDGLPKEGKVVIEAGANVDKEEVELKFDILCKYDEINEKVTIKFPSEKDIAEI